jgi:hypothetical protein
MVESQGSVISGNALPLGVAQLGAVMWFATGNSHVSAEAAEDT